MKRVDEHEVQRDIETPDSIRVRFGIDFLEADLADATIAMSMSMPMAGLRNPFTGAPAVGLLAVLVDAAGGMSNHYRRRTDQWTVTTELTLELSPAEWADAEEPVLARARPLGPVGATTLALCTLSRGGAVIGAGTVRSYFIPAGDLRVDRGAGAHRTPARQLSDLLAVDIDVSCADATSVLRQRVDPDLNNVIGIVHGGVAAASLELTASAAINADHRGDLLRTASLRVNFLRPFLAGLDSRYVGTPLRLGRTSAVGDARAIGEDGKAAITARLTAYR
ncbi:MAG TPA: PaaI family thioesterase [Mycobacterium sp.]|nr:PaaI family thioesterase [Mycobacterium sp.]HKI41410.1 PaaI family thioesterase [Mycobacterium sp.]